MKLIDRFYKTKNLAKNGSFLLVSILVWIVVGNLIIPQFKDAKVDRQIFDVKGVSIKYDDHEIVSNYLKSIKANDGYLCLGTSESGVHKEGNYYDFINNDPDIQSNRLSVLAGAGRTCGIHIPMFLNHREEVDSLKVIYFINPIYWRLYFSSVSEYYWDRYCNYNVAKNVSLSNAERKEFYGPVEEYFKLLPEDKKVSLIIDDLIRKNRRSYFQDLQFLISPNTYYKELNYLTENSGKLDDFYKFGQVDYDKMDTTWNVLKSYLPDRGFRPIEENDKYRYRELRAFVRLCKNLNVQATFIIGPYNQRFIEKYDGLPPFERVVENVRELLEQEEADYIDASDISNEIGAFNDFQHHSSYGAYLIYKKIKKRLYER